MGVRIQGGVLGATEQDVIRMTAKTSASLQGQATTVKGEVTMIVEGGTVKVDGRKVFVTSDKGVVEISAPEVRIKTPGGTVVLDASGVSVSGAVVKLNCR
jgi:hypothetical protein